MKKRTRFKFKKLTLRHYFLLLFIELSILITLSFFFLQNFVFTGSVIDTNITGYKLDPNETLNISIYNICKQIINEGDKTYFIPTKTREGWNAFINNHPDDISSIPCGTAFLPGATNAFPATNASPDTSDSQSENQQGTTETSRNEFPTSKLIFYFLVGLILVSILITIYFLFNKRKFMNLEREVGGEIKRDIGTVERDIKKIEKRFS